MAEEDVDRVQKLFGGKQKLGRHVKTRWDAHELLKYGIKGKAFHHFVVKLGRVHRGEFLHTIGMSERTYQRHMKVPAKEIGRDQSGRAWKFAEILMEATAVLGSQEAAEEWLETPALALNRRRPIDLLTTPSGTELVSDLLVRLKYGVYT
jgi:putative toxin-antitoxin system antitoxin component (TIGR02293 family)